MTTKAVASDTFRDTLHYRRECFLGGLARCGYEVGHPPKRNPEPQDVLLTWNRHGLNADHADRYERAGARVVVAENGFIGSDADGHQLYALALRHHLGAGEWKQGQDGRWSALRVQLRPWRRDGRQILVLPQRGIGPKGVAMPHGWAEDVVRRLKSVTDRPVVVRQHPGASRTDPWEDLRTAWAAVTWASGAGIKSICHGVPVFHELPQWIGSPAARYGIHSVEDPYLSDRLPMLERLAHAQFTIGEIASGEPFRRLLG